MRVNGSLLIVAWLTLGFSTVPAKAVELLNNGGFEDGSYNGWTINFVPPNDAAWIVSQSSFGGGRVHDGNYAVDFDVFGAAPTAVLSQTFSTVAGSTYDVSFWFGAVSLVGYAPAIDVQILGNGGSSIVSNNYSIPGNNGIQWEFKHFDFTATGSSTTIRIADASSSFNPVSDALLDTVSVTGIAGAVPEPSTWAMMLIGLLGIGTLTLARRHGHAAAT